MSIKNQSRSIEIIQNNNLLIGCKKSTDIECDQTELT